MMEETNVYIPKGIFVLFCFVFLNQSAHTQDPLRSLGILTDTCIWSYLIWGGKHLLWFNSIQRTKNLSLPTRSTFSSILTYKAAGSQFSVKLFPKGTGLTWRDKLQSNTYYFKKTNAFVLFQRGRKDGTCKRESAPGLHVGKRPFLHYFLVEHCVGMWLGSVEKHKNNLFYLTSTDHKYVQFCIFIRASSIFGPPNRKHRKGYSKRLDEAHDLLGEALCCIFIYSLGTSENKECKVNTHPTVSGFTSATSVTLQNVLWTSY